MNFKLTLAGTYWDRKPEFSVLLNDEIVVTQSVTAVSGESFEIHFDKEVPEGPLVLKVRFENKQDSDVLKDQYNDPNNFKIIGDMLLHIRDLSIDDIQLDNILWSKSLYIPDDTKNPPIEYCVDLGWKGTWQLEMASPFYLWLLENI